MSVVRPETIRDRKTKQVVKVLSARERGALLLKRLHVTGKAAARFRFVEGDVEKPDFGIEASGARAAAARAHPRGALRGERVVRRPLRELVPRQRARLPERARVLEAVQAAPGLALRRPRGDRDLVHPRPPQALDRAGGRASCSRATSTTTTTSSPRRWPRSRPTARWSQDGLRVTQLLPSIVIGHTRTGNNRGDTKVLNAPVNAFGRAQEALAELGREPADRLRALVVGRIATSFPARSLGGAQPGAGGPGGGRDPRVAHGAGGDRRPHPPRDRQPHPLGGDLPHRRGGAGRQGAA